MVVGSDFAETTPGDVCQVGCTIACLGQKIGPIEEAGYARVKGDTVVLATDNTDIGLGFDELGVIEALGQVCELPGIGGKVFLGIVVFNEDDVWKTGFCFCRKGGVQFLLKVCLCDFDNLEFCIRMFDLIAVDCFLHDGNVEIGVPGPDGNRGCVAGCCFSCPTGKQTGRHDKDQKERQCLFFHRKLLFCSY